MKNVDAIFNDETIRAIEIVSRVGNIIQTAQKVEKHLKDDKTFFRCSLKTCVVRRQSLARGECESAGKISG